MSSLDDFARQKLATLERDNLRRAMVPTERQDALRVERNGRRLLSFSCNDYLALTHHPALKQAAIAATERYGVGAGASRLVTGNHPLYAELEQRLAQLKSSEAACVFGSGYLVNAGIPQALLGRGDLVLIDELAHSSLWTGARLSRAQVHPFRHNDTGHAGELLRQYREPNGRALVISEGVFSMDGDRAPIAELAALAQDYDAWLMIDDAHDLDFSTAARAKVPLRIGTLSKAIGAYGGYLCASQPVIDLMRSRARTLIYTTGLPPATIATAIAAVDLIEREPQRLAAPLAKARNFTRAAGLPEAQSAIVPIVIGAADATLAASRLLESEGFLVVAIRPPTVPQGTARLRLAFSAAHPDDEIARLAEIVRTRILSHR
ncbi:MAG: aminotransferase class I/II-fold pyridoxal phosphate-dependent enzyme [Rhizobiales bacterium]|nr:aminotransferase class I/II-fold pyridoxal phosphate-dependent enzyme [Hyphomicrobiales bacterium]